MIGLKKYYLIIFVFLSLSIKGYSQGDVLSKYNSFQSDSVKLHAIYQVVDFFYNKDEELFFQYLKEYEQLAITLKSDKELAAVNRRYANFYIKKQMYENALFHSNKALQLDLKIQYRGGITSDYLSIADVYMAQKQYYNSLLLYKEIIDDYKNDKKNPFTYGIGNIQYLISNVYYHQKKYQLALQLVDQSITNIRLGDNYDDFFNEPKNRDPLLAKSYLIKIKILQSLGLEKEIHDVLDSVSILIDKWDFFHERIEYNWIKTNYEFDQEGKVNLDNIEGYLLEVKQEELNLYVVNYYNLLKTYFEQEGNYRLALEYSDSIAYYQSKINQTESTDAKNKYLAKFETKKAEYESEQSKLETENQKQKVVIVSGLSLGLLIVLLFILFTLQTKKKSHKQALSLKDLKIDELLRKNELENLQGLLAGQEVERKRIAQDLHDTIGGMLSTIKLHFNALGKSKELKGYHAEIFTNADQLLDESCIELRRVSHDLNQGSVASYGLKENLKTLKNTLELTSEVAVNLIVDDIELPSNSTIEKELFKVIQELLSNTLKHAQATEINIQLSQFDDELQLIFEDNGIGFNVNKITRGLGLDSIQKRIAKIQGGLTIDSHEKSGTTFIFEIPLNA